MPTALEPSYVTVADMRAEGVPASVLDAFLESRIALASRFVDAATGRFFAPRELTLLLDGQLCSRGRLELPVPVIAIDGLAVDGVEVFSDYFRIYNRHLTGLLRPDDRDYPLIELTDGRFATGRQNVEVIGVFGYTDPDGTAFGKTPELIKHVTKLLVMREIGKMANGGERLEAQQRSRINSERTRDQAYTLEARPAGGGFGSVSYFTGDPEIDRILLMYKRPPDLGAV